MVTSRQAYIGDTIVTVYSGNRNDLMPVTVNINDRYINKDDHINYKYTSTGWVEEVEESELPVVTAADNDKVLKVVNGAWNGVNRVDTGMQHTS